MGGIIRTGVSFTKKEDDGVQNKSQTLFQKELQWCAVHCTATYISRLKVLLELCLIQVRI